LKKSRSSEEESAPSVDLIEPIASFYPTDIDRTFDARSGPSEYAVKGSSVAEPERRRSTRQRDYWAWHDTLYLGGSSRSPEWKERAREAKRRDGRRCRMCGSDQKLQTDHIVPLSKGGSNEFENLQTLCKACHELKTGRPLRDWNDPDEF
jgi:5-methylcytosine-specific restriction endonuclease McrA